MAKSKPFIAAVEGETATDGRLIEASWIRDIVATYNTATYGARINLEHIRGYSPEPPFNAYGDVVSAQQKTIDLNVGGKIEKRLALELVVEGQPSLVELSKKKQKVYPSIEVAPNFAGTGKAYLVGLAFTDSPASLGTQMLQFSTKDDPAAKEIKAMLDARKQDPANFFSATRETQLEWAEAEGPGDAENAVVKIFASIGDKILASIGGKPEPVKPANEPTGDQVDLAALANAFKEGLGEVGKAVAESAKATDAKFAAFRTDFDALKAELDNTPKHSNPRQPATGGSGRVLADF